MVKILKNVTENPILLSDVGKTISSGQEFNTEGRQDTFINSNNTLTAIRNGSLQVGDGSKFYTDALEGEAYFKTRFDDNAFLIDGSEVIEFTPEIVTDEPTGKKATNLFMDILTMLKEFYNAPGDPLYEEGFQPLLGENGREVEHLTRTLNLETIHGDTGWHRREIKSYGYQAPLNLLFYYGWPNSFNSVTNGWDNEKVAQDMSKYSLIVWGDGIQDPSHGDHENAHTIINRIKVLNPQTKIFGYVTCNQTYANFQTKTDQWNDMLVHGIFMDECGYDNGIPRDVFNQKVTYAHGKTYSNICFVNAWNMDHIIGTTNDPSYPNSTWNAGLSASSLITTDWYLLESFPINTTAYSGSGGYETKTDWKTRGDKAITHRDVYGINIAAVGIVNNDNASAQNLFNFGYISALMYALEAFGTSDTSYGSSSASVTFWTRPDVTGLGRIWFNSFSVSPDSNDADVYYRSLERAKLLVDFSTGAQLSRIVKTKDENAMAIKFLESLTLTNSPAAVREISNVTYYRMEMDLSRYTKYRVTLRVQTAGYSGADVHFQGSLDDSIFSVLDGTSGPEISIDSTGERDTGWVTLAENFRRDSVRIRMMEKDGNGTADPVLRQIVLHFK